MFEFKRLFFQRIVFVYYTLQGRLSLGLWYLVAVEQRRFCFHMPQIMAVERVPTYYCYYIEHFLFLFEFLYRIIIVLWYFYLIICSMARLFTVSFYCHIHAIFCSSLASKLYASVIHICPSSIYSVIFCAFLHQFRAQSINS